MKMVNVTKHDIKIGHRGSIDQCPVALALVRATGRRWEVTDRRCWNSGGIGFFHPEVVKKFIKEFDSGAEVSPFSFEIKD